MQYKNNKKVGLNTLSYKKSFFPLKMRTIENNLRRTRSRSKLSDSPHGLAQQFLRIISRTKLEVVFR